MRGSASSASTWDRHAARYARQERLELRAIDVALRLAEIGSQERVVDLGTGTGLLLRRLAARPDPPREAVGVDRSHGMLERGGALPGGWSALEADARAVPLADGWADVVTCAYVLHLLEPGERHEVLCEARRLLGPAPGARLVTVTPWTGTGRPGARLAGAALGLMARARPAAWGGLRPLDPTADLVRAGFAVTRRAVLRRGGYPSLVLRAQPSFSAS